MKIVLDNLFLKQGWRVGSRFFGRNGHLCHGQSIIFLLGDDGRGRRGHGKVIGGRLNNDLTCEIMRQTRNIERETLFLWSKTSCQCCFKWYISIQHS